MSSTSPFPHRVTAGYADRARHFDRLAECEAAKLDRIERAIDHDRDRPPTCSHLTGLTRRREEARLLVRAFETLASLHRQGWVPAPLFGVRTRRHVLTVLQNEALHRDELQPVRSALRFTLGLPMPRAHGFRLMREAFETLGLVQPGQPPALAAGDGHAAPLTAPPAAPVTFEAWTAAVDGARRDDDGRGLCQHFRTVDFHEAFERGMTPDEVVRAITGWIVGCDVHGPRPFTWDTEDRTDVTNGPVGAPAAHS